MISSLCKGTQLLTTFPSSKIMDSQTHQRCCGVGPGQRLDSCLGRVTSVEEAFHGQLGRECSVPGLWVLSRPPISCPHQPRAKTVYLAAGL